MAHMEWVCRVRGALDVPRAVGVAGDVSRRPLRILQSAVGRVVRGVNARVTAGVGMWLQH